MSIVSIWSCIKTVINASLLLLPIPSSWRNASSSFLLRNLSLRLTQHFYSHSSPTSQVYPLMFGSQKIPVFCHMGNFGCGDGGWTLAMKINGAKVQISLLRNLLLTFYQKLKHFSLVFREPSIMIQSFGATKMVITFQEARLVSTHKRPSYRPTGRHRSPRSVSV